MWDRDGAVPADIVASGHPNGAPDPEVAAERDAASTAAAATAVTTVELLEPFTGTDPDPELVGAGAGWSRAELGQPGTLAFWPGFVNHTVPVHLGDKRRVSVAFNLLVTLEPAEKPSRAKVK